MVQINTNNSVSQINSEIAALRANPDLNPQETVDLQHLYLDLQQLQTALSQLTPARANDKDYQALVSGALKQLNLDMQNARKDFAGANQTALFEELTNPIEQVLGFSPNPGVESPFGESGGDPIELADYLNNFASKPDFFTTFILGGITTELSNLAFVEPTAK